jgi:hypothetical protein
MRIFGLDTGKQVDHERQVVSQTVITRFLADHPKVFKVLVENDQYNREIVEMMHLNPVDKRTAFLVVGVKTCFSGNISEIRRLQDHHGGGVELPVDAGLAAAGLILPPGFVSMSVGAHVKQSKSNDILSSYIAEGERVFAIQYRQIKRHRDWLNWTAPSTLRYGDLEHVSDGVGLFGDGDEVEDDLEPFEEEDEDSVDSTTLEVGVGLPQGTIVGSLLLANL